MSRTTRDGADAPDRTARSRPPLPSRHLQVVGESDAVPTAGVWPRCGAMHGGAVRPDQPRSPLAKLLISVNAGLLALSGSTRRDGLMDVGIRAARILILRGYPFGAGS
jgi:hypothetical protein